MKWDFYERLQAALGSGASTAVVTRLSDGAQSLFDGSRWDGAIALDDEQRAAAARMLLGDRSGALPGSNDLFIRCYARPPRLIVVGAAHISQFLAPMAALAGFEVIVVDPRRAFASTERFAGVKLMNEWPDEALAKLKLDSTCAVVTLTHDPKLDDPALIAALTSPRGRGQVRISSSRSMIVAECSGNSSPTPFPAWQAQARSTMMRSRPWPPMRSATGRSPRPMPARSSTTRYAAIASRCKSRCMAARSQRSRITCVAVCSAGLPPPSSASTPPARRSPK